MSGKKDISEEELLAGCRANDRMYQEHFYRLFAEKMLRMVFRYTSDRELALDIVNRGFLKAFQKMDQFQQKGSLEGWLRRIVFRKLSDHFRSEKQKLRFLEIQENDRALPDGALEKLYYEDLLDLTEKLPDSSRQVFCLYAIEGFTHEEIGKQLGISPGTSKWHLSEARKKLKALIQQFYHHAI